MMTLAEIAKKIRADIKSAKKSGELPADLKVSVRSESFAMGAALRVAITDGPFAKYDPKAERAMGKLDEIVKSYHEHERDPHEPDCWSNNFWFLGTSFDC